MRRITIQLCRVERNMKPRAVAAAVVLLAAFLAAGPAGAAPGWSDPVKISGDVELFITPYKEIALDFDGHLHLAWMAGTDSYVSQVYHADNTSGSWPASPTMLSTYPGVTASWRPQIAVDSDGYAHVVWCGEEGAIRQIYYADNTAGWPAIPTRIPETPSITVKYPQIAVDSNGYSHLVWSGFDSGDFRILYANNSTGWPAVPTSISNDPAVLGNVDSKMALDSDGYAHVTWLAWDGTSPQVYYADNTSGWPALQTRLSDPGVHSNLESRIAVDSDGYAHVVWQGGPITQGNIYYSDNTSGWPTTPTTLPPGLVSGGSNLYPRIAVDSNGYSHVVWDGRTADGLAALYADNTSGWPASPTLLSPGYPGSGFPRIATDSRGYSHVAWTVNTGGVNKVYYGNNISGWPADPIDVGGDTFRDAGRPQIALDSHDRPHIVWNGKSGPETGIYYSHLLPTPSPAPTPEYLVLDSGDYTGDGISDIAVFRQDLGLWSVRGLGRTYYGRNGDIPVSGDYDGDGLTDVSLFRPSSGLWAIKEVTRLYFGDAGDRPVPGDYDGDGSCDVALFRDSNGLWSVRGVTRLYYGSAGDLPVPGDYDGSGLAEIAIFRPSSGLWAIRDITRAYFGTSGDRPVPGSYSWYGGAGKEASSFRAVIAVFRPSSGLWAVRGDTRYYYGASGDTPFRGDFDGDNLDESGIFRPSSGLWAIQGLSRLYYGTAGDIPAVR